MKKLIIISLAMLMLATANISSSQEVKKDARAVKNETKKDAKKVGNKTAEVASKTKAKVTDKTYKDKTGPDGQTIYIDKHAKYYWVDKKGHKTYVTNAELKDK